MSSSDQLLSIARQIRDFQERNALSDSALCKDFAGLGSTKTYKRILDGDLDELNLDRQLENYTRVLELTRIKRDPENDRIYDDLRHVRQTYLAISEAYQEKGNDRLIILEGPTGSGKTETCNIIESRFAAASIRVEAHGGWKIGNNPLSIMAGDILEAARLREYSSERKSDSKSETKLAVGDSIPVSFAERKRKLFDHLCLRKRILICDEGQEIGPFCFNFLKSIINQTPTIVLLAVIPTIFRRLESRSYDDAIQLTGNRLYERIRIPSPQPDEVSLFLDRRGIKFDDSDRDPCIAKLVDLAPIHANWKFIARFARRARAAKGSVDAEQFIEHVRAIERARKG